MDIKELRKRYGRGSKGRTRRFHYGYSLQDIATLSNYSLATIKKKVQKGIFNPKSFESTINFIFKRKIKQEKEVVDKRNPHPE